MRSISLWFLGSLVFSSIVVASEARARGVSRGEPGIERGLVKIETIDRDGYRKSGSGFVVGMEGVIAYVVTAAHVVAGGEPEVTFWTDRDRPRVAEVIAMDVDHDLAALKTWPVPLGVVPIPLERTAGAQRGEHLHVLGFPKRSLTPVSTFGWMSGWNGLRILVDAEADTGSSGGPLLRGARAVGLITETRDGRAQAVPATVLGPALEGWGVRSGSRANGQAARSGTSWQRLPQAALRGDDGSCRAEILVRRGALRPVRTIPSQRAPSRGMVPEGALVRVTRRSFGEGSTWYWIDFSVPGGFGQGWIPGDQVQLLSNCSF